MMFDAETLKVKYDKYTDEELFELHSAINDYSEEAKEAFDFIVAKKGGLEELQSRIKSKQIIKKEIERVRNEVTKAYVPGGEILLRETITSDILNSEELEQAIDVRQDELTREEIDKKITSRTVIGSVIGGLAASTVSGTLWGIFLIQTHRILFVMIFGIAALCYGIIKLSTRQSKQNKMVVISTAVSVALALLIGWLIFGAFG
ncbi:phosphatase PAP2 family protein [Pinibacter aurantiacus]|uniref:Uncharacterized protein n=1 Tax=Pinibacter aurantiacus TaxID=2851599 RepID=A0A9E2S882_9BACT|nr:hypothetical protein [Pinibacter aurantiacus]MBV4356319.1 hypothetical protein [Pinibacter aurantiacus]